MKSVEIREILQRVFNNSYYGGCEPEIRIIRDEKDHLLVEVTDMYDSPTFSYSKLEDVRIELGFVFAEKFEDITNYGCETCDYGSSYGFALRFWN